MSGPGEIPAPERAAAPQLGETTSWRSPRWWPPVPPACAARWARCWSRTGRSWPPATTASPAGSRHCEERGCLRDELGIPSGERHELCRGAARRAERHHPGRVPRRRDPGAELYCTHQPCVICAKMLVNAGIVAVYYAGDYPDALAMEVFEEAGTRLVRKEIGLAPRKPRMYIPVSFRDMTIFSLAIAARHCL